MVGAPAAALAVTWLEMLVCWKTHAGGTRQQACTQRWLQPSRRPTGHAVTTSHAAAAAADHLPPSLSPCVHPCRASADTIASAHEAQLNAINAQLEEATKAKDILADDAGRER